MGLIQSKVEQLLGKLPSVEDELGQPNLFSDQKRFQALSRQHAHLNSLSELWRQYKRVQHDIEETRQLIKDESDKQLLEAVQEELATLVPREAILLAKIEQALVPPDPYDSRNTIMELRAGAGGDEAALFVGDCIRMYQLYADAKGWKYDILSASPSERGGYKEFIMSLSGPDVYKHLRNEAGGHRVQRVPETEAQGRVHTSAITVAVMPEVDEEEEIKLDDKELRIDTMRSSGAGGQHVNTTDSAVRITHLPTNTVVYCQQERSQIKNRDTAMRMLQAKLVEMERARRAQEESSLRSSQIGTGDRSDRIRTYNFSQNRVSDHRIELTLYNLNYVMNGDLDCLIQPLIMHFHNQRLSEIDD